MDLHSWKKVVFKWVEGCNFVNSAVYSIEETDLEIFFDSYMNYFSLRVSPRKNTQLLAFVTAFYPDFVPQCDDYGLVNKDDYIYLYSIMMHYSCVRNPKEYFHEVCKSLPDDVQECIAKFFSQIMEYKAITREALQQCFVNISSASSNSDISVDFGKFSNEASDTATKGSSLMEGMSPLTSSPATCSPPTSFGTPQMSGARLISPVTPKSAILENRQRELFHLRANLETERYEKTLLEMNIKCYEERIDELTNALEKQSILHKKLLLRIKDDDDAVEESDDQTESPYSNYEQIKKHLANELAEKDAVIIELKERIQNIEDENNTWDKKHQKATATYLQRISEMDTKIAELLDDIKEKNILVNYLKSNIAELEKCLNENRLASESGQRADLNNSSDLMNVSNYSPEDLASTVIDVQLREKEHENEALRNDLEKLKDSKLKMAKKLKVLNQQIIDNFKLDAEIESINNYGDTNEDNTDENLILLTEKCIEMLLLHKNSFDSLVTDNDQLLQQIKLLQNAELLLGNHIDEMERNNKLLKAEKETLGKLLDESKETINQINMENNDLIQKVNKLQFCNENFETNLNNCTKDISYLRCKLNESIKYKDKYEILLKMHNELKLCSSEADSHLIVMRSELAEKDKQIAKVGSEISELRTKNVELEEQISSLTTKHDSEMQMIMQQLEEKLHQMNALENELHKCQGAQKHLNAKYQLCCSELIQCDNHVNALLYMLRVDTLEEAFKIIDMLFVYKDYSDQNLDTVNVIIEFKQNNIDKSEGHIKSAVGHLEESSALQLSVEMERMLKDVKERNCVLIEQLKKDLNRRRAELEEQIAHKFTNKFEKELYEERQNNNKLITEINEKYKNCLIGFMDHISKLTLIKFDTNYMNMNNDELLNHGINVIESILHSKDKEISQLKLNVEQKNVSSDILMQQYDDLKNEYEKIMTNCERYTKQIEEKEFQLYDYKQQLDKKNKEILAAEEDAQRDRKELNNVLNLFAKIIENTAETNYDINEAAGNNADDTNTVKYTSFEGVQLFEQKLKALVNSLNKLKQLNTQLKCQSLADSKTTDDLSKENKKLKEQLEHTLSRLNKSGVKVAEAQMEVANLLRENHQYTVTINHNNKTIKTLQDEKDRLENEQNVTKNELSALLNKIELLNNHYVQEVHNNNKMTSLYNDIESKFLKETEHADKLKKAHEYLEEKILKMSMKIEHYESETISVTLKNGELNARIEQSKKKMIKLCDDVENLRTELTRFQLECQLINEQSAIERSSKNALAKELKETKEKFEKEQNATYNMRNEIRDLIKKNSLLCSLNKLVEAIIAFNNESRIKYRHYLNILVLELRKSEDRYEQLLATGYNITNDISNMSQQSLFSYGELKKRYIILQFKYAVKLAAIYRVNSDLNKISSSCALQEQIIDGLHLENNNIKTQYEEKLQKLECSLFSINKKLSDCRLQNEKLTEKLKVALTENDLQQSKLSNLEYCLEHERKFNTQLTEDVKVLRVKYQNAKECLQEKNNESEKRIKEQRLELEGKLEKMKIKMKALYAEEKAKLMTKYEHEIANLKSELEQNKNFEDHARKLSTQIVRLNDTILGLRKENTMLSTKLKHVETAQTNIRSSSTHVSTMPVSVATSAVNMGTNLAMEDEEGEVFNNTYLTDLKCGSLPEITSAELRYRNSLLPPHLKSAYAAYDLDANEEDIKDGPQSLDDSMIALLSTTSGNNAATRKKSYGTHYKRPGPPTPSKHCGRLSFGGNSEPTREILKETYDDNNVQTSALMKTPARFGFLSSRFNLGCGTSVGASVGAIGTSNATCKGSQQSNYKDENTPPKRRLSNLFKRK